MSRKVTTQGEYTPGWPFWDYCRQAIIVPLRMNDSSWRPAGLDRDRYAFTYAKDSGTLTKEEPSTWPGYTDGGLNTTLAGASFGSSVT